ncbi:MULTISPECIES: hypothetical protein [Streptomyces]|uniref:hypothetical protein n=1 Tax=Streptomyces TaxID=1883 RepID=UPI000F506C72|nr:MULTISPECIES: hypothetical protein [Streptomyces]QUI34828.1 hypothetical protein H9W91_31250 [Streptomyces alfalfae]
MTRTSPLGPDAAPDPAPAATPPNTPAPTPDPTANRTPDAHRPPRQRPRPHPRPGEPRLLPRGLPGADGERPAPDVVRGAFALWLTAVAAGVFETVLAMVRALTEADASTGGLAAGLALRVAVYSAAVLVAVRMRRGANWARLALAGVLGVLGTLSLVIEPVRWLADGHTPGEAFRHLDAVDVLFGASRVLHLAAVLAAVTLMFRPAANTWFKK